MGKASSIVSTELFHKLIDHGVDIDDADWWDDNLHYVVINHPDAPDRRHVDVIFDEKGLRFKPDIDV